MDDEQEKTSADDVFEEGRPGQLNHSIGNQPLPEDNDSPAAPASDTGESRLPDEHPTHDTGIDDEERYEGEV